MYLEIDNRLGCEQGGCFRTADGAADYLGALSAWEMLRDFPYQLKTVSSKGNVMKLPITRETINTNNT